MSVAGSEAATGDVGTSHDVSQAEPVPARVRVGRGAKPRGLVARLRGAAQWVRHRFPLTFAGLVAGAAGAWAFFDYGLGRLDFVLLVIGASALLMVSLALLGTVVSAALIRYRAPASQHDANIEGECETWIRTGFEQWRRRWIPLVSVRWDWVEPKAELRLEARGPKLEEWVRVQRRGIYPRLVRRFDVGDFFGFCRLQFEMVDDRRLRFVPNVGALDRIEVVRGVAGGDDFAHPEGPPDGSPLDLRPYVPGDPLRFVLWKIFARTRELVVRTPERALSPARHAVAYLVTDASDEPSAGAARAAVDVGALGEDWVLGADGASRDAENQGAALDLLANSAHASSAGGRDLANFLQRVAPTGERRAVIFVPARKGPWVDRVLGAFDARGGEIEFIVCTDGIAPARPAKWWARWSTRDDELGGASALEDVVEVVKALEGPRSKVLVLDRKGGQIYGKAHVQKMMQGVAA